MENFDMQQVWSTFSLRAIDKVRRGSYPSWKHALEIKRLFATLTAPSFDDVVGGEVYRVKANKPDADYIYHAFRTVWKQMTDQRKIHVPVKKSPLLHFHALSKITPTVEHAAVVPDATVISTAFERMTALRLPLDVDVPIMGADGTSYELILGDYFAQITIHWWEDAPKEWREAEEIVTQTLAHLERTYRESL